jgi:hypothetical protein
MLLLLKFLWRTEPAAADQDTGERDESPDIFRLYSGIDDALQG